MMTYPFKILVVLVMVASWGCKVEESRIPRGYPTQEQEFLKLRKKDYKPVKKDYSKQWARLHKRDSLYRSPEWRRDRELQKHIFYPIAIGGPFFINALPHTFAYMPI